MNAKDVIGISLTSTQHMLNMCFNDMSDADLLIRPVPAANNIAWQLGHLINSEVGLGNQIPGATYPALPAGFKEAYTKETAKGAPPGGYLKKSEYLELFNSVRAATLANLKKMNEADLDKPTEGNMKEMVPTLGALLMLNGSHVMMHFGQFSVVRRALGKPVLF